MVFYKLGFERKSNFIRKTSETEINISINLDGRGKVEASTGIGFFDHMLDLLGKHSGIDIMLEARGDLAVDAHHTVEDVAICMGKALKESLGEKKGITRYGHIILPMDEALVLVALDLSGRVTWAWKRPFRPPEWGIWTLSWWRNS